ncbi:hypothetical protein QTR17_003817 [Salmonella enterica]|uniref:hypothetical protein n=1 Tax=Salmonella enterica TaxID=28901 RepID=UPI000A47F90B|nr:hypothetical protein [Salmonella enterica]EKO9120376.1 hypothetical protein [Salmonella enterica]ELH4157651.1 hypothetical protein [Salmonella enterica]ELP5617321.1 hypothetical protein [Salmonella enterica]
MMAGGEAACQPARKKLAGCRLPEKREAAPAALQPRLSGYGMMRGCIICPGRIMQ